jgi:hypothetical protein
LLVSAEYLLQQRHSPNSVAPLINDQKGTAATTDDQIVGYARALARNWNAYGPTSELNRGASSYTTNYDKRLNDIFSVRASGNYYLARRWDYNSNNSWPTVNINPAVATKVSDRGTGQAIGVVTDVGLFLEHLAKHLS